MKRSILLLSLLLCVFLAQAQFFQGFGLMGGLTLGRQKWWIDLPDGSESISRTRRLLRFNAEVFAEFVNHPNFRWRTELQYNQKGSLEKSDAGKFRNRLDYICWNNFLILRQEDFLGTPYFLIGPRVEYKLTQATESPVLSGIGFKPLHFTWSAGLGWEFVTYGALKPVVEVHYNPVINRSADQAPVAVKNRAWEFRLGFKVVFNTTGCPPVYK